VESHHLFERPPCQNPSFVEGRDTELKQVSTEQRGASPGELGRARPAAPSDVALSANLI
jgi:hypothetical protein